MKKSPEALILAFSVSFMAVQSVYAMNDGTDSHGGDSSPSARTSAWFLDPDKTISYCLEISSDFPWSQTPEVLDAKIHAAFSKWKAYYLAKLADNARFVSARRDLNLDFNLATSGSCAGRADLTFYFGKKSAEVERIQKDLNLQAAGAFSYLTRYDPTQHFGSGFIWFSPVRDFEFEGTLNKLDWTQSTQSTGKTLLDVFLLHEIGHVMGNPHIPGTIMDENILTQAVLNPGKTTLSEIDQEKEMVTRTGTSKFDTIYSASSANELILGYNALLVGNGFEKELKYMALKTTLYNVIAPGAHPNTLEIRTNCDVSNVLGTYCQENTLAYFTKVEIEDLSENPYRAFIRRIADTQFTSVPARVTDRFEVQVENQFESRKFQITRNPEGNFPVMLTNKVTAQTSGFANSPFDDISNSKENSTGHFSGIRVVPASTTTTR